MTDKKGQTLEGCSSFEDHTTMTSSYHEICDEEGGKERTGDGELTQSLPVQGARRLLDRARNWVGDLSLEGVVSQEGHQVTYVTQDLNNKIKISSPTKEVGLPSEEKDSTYSQHDDTTISDLNVVVNEMEMEAKKLASSVDTLTENLTGILHSLSSMTMDCVFTAQDGVIQLCDTADASIKVMYQVMAKCEELNKAVQPLYQVQQQIKETKRLLDKVESEIN